MNIQDIVTARTILILKEISIGGLSTHLKPLRDSTIVDVETDGEYLKYNPNVKLSAEDLAKKITISIVSYLEKGSNSNYEKFKEIALVIENYATKKRV